MTLTTDQALANLSTAAAQFKGTLDDHNGLQESLKVIKEALSPKPVEAEESKE